MLRFNHLRKKYPNLKSVREFLTSDDYLGNNVLEIIYYDNFFTGKDVYDGLVKAFEKIAKDVTSIKPEYRGSETFKAKAINKVIKDKYVMLKIEDRDDLFDGVGVSQNEVSDERLRLDLSKEKWYVYQDNIGTDEEKRFLVYFKNYIVPKLEKKNLEFYIVRNERIADLAIYSFDDGERFEPDFLLEIEDKAKIDQRYTFNNNYKVMGLPLFNEEHTLVKCNKVIDEMIADL